MIEIDSNEKILRIVRRHWFVLLGEISALVFMIAIPVVLLALAALAGVDRAISFEGNESVAGAFLLFAWILIVWMFAWHIWTDYYLDVLIITDKRVFDIEQHGLFRRESSAFRIDRIQNVTVNVKGIIQTFLDFGTITIETAGEREEFVATCIAKPYEIKKFLNECHDNALERSQLVHLASEDKDRIRAINDHSGLV